MCANYPSDLTDEQWQLIRPLLPKRKKRSRPPIDRRDVIDAILYVVRTGCQWRQLPLDFPKWRTVYTRCCACSKAGVWQQIHDCLRRRVRRAAGKKSTPTVAIIDSQSFHPPKEVKSVATTLVRRSPVASGTWQSIRWVWCGPW